MKNLLALLALCSFTSSLMCMQSTLKKSVVTDEDIASCLLACKRGDRSTAQAMLAKGVQINTSLGSSFAGDGQEDTTFLHWSIQHPDMVTLLINSGADVNAMDEEKRTPLCQAVCNLQLQSVKLLLENNADPKLTDISMNNPLHEVTRCAGQGFLGITLPLPEKTMRACVIIQMLKAHDAPLYLQNEALNTPFHFAAPCQNPDIVLNVLMPKGLPVRLQKEARARLFAFLCMNKRHQLTRNSLPPLPRDVIFKLFSFMPLDCKHAQIERLIVPTHMKQESFTARYVKDIIPKIKEHMTEQELGTLELALTSPNIKQLTPQQNATDQIIKQLLDPETWGN